MGYTAKDENLFSNKNKVTLDRYNKLRSDYENVIKNYNGINLIIDNPTALSYPYLNTKQKSTEIAKKYRDKKYISNSNSSYEKIGVAGETKTEDIQKGFYKIVLIGAGSGGIAYGKISGCASSSGTSGSALILNVYFPVNGQITYYVGKGGKGKCISSGNGEFYSDNGGDSYIKFNNLLVAQCHGGNKVKIRRPDGSANAVSEQTFGGEYEIGNYVLNVLNKKVGNKNTYGSNGNQEVHRCTRPFSSYQYGNGGEAKASIDGQGTSAEPYGYGRNGENGYFRIISIDSSEFGFINEKINVESTKIHTLGNENEIRRKISEALNKIYNKLSLTSILIKDECREIGEKTNEEVSDIKPYSQTGIENKNWKDIFEDIKKLSKVITKKGEHAIFPEDDYIVTYDWNQKRKLKLEEFDGSGKNLITHKEYDDSYIPYKHGNDIIYIKNTDINKQNINIYKLINGNYVYQGKGGFETASVKKYESSIGGTNTTITLDKGKYRVICIGAGGGSVAQYRIAQGGAKAAGGGSGSGFDVVLELNSGTYQISIGKGGNSVAKQRFLNYKNNLAGTNGSNTRFGNCYAYGGTAGKDGGDTVGTGGGSCTIPYTIISTSFIKKGNNGKKHSSHYYANGVGGDAIYKTYGKGGYAQATKDDGVREQKGNDGYLYIESNGSGKLVYNNNEYEEYSEYITNTPFTYGGIKWSDYQYDLQKLNRLKQYVATKDSWFDSDGYCQRSCQINCQTTVQKS